MKIIQTGDRRVVKIISRKIRPDSQYRLSGYTYPFSEGSVFLLHNTLTGMTAALSESERSLIENAGISPVSGSKLQEEDLSDLVSHCFLVDHEYEDHEQYSLVVSVLKNLKRVKKGTSSYIILPTTACNARCVYCYEEGMPVFTMNEEIADRTVDFIERTRWQDKINITWFGGEPLAGSSSISRICKKLNDKEIPFKSRIITNATLLTPELLEEADTLWHLHYAQVSVDGSRKDYEARKQFVNHSAHHYDAMMDAVGLMLDRGIRVTLRCNYDKDNVEGLKTFFDDLKLRFGTPKNLTVYTAMLYQARAQENSTELYQDVQELQEYLSELGIHNRTSVEKAHKLKTNMCMADSGDKSVVIAPDGKLYHCQHLPGNSSYGSIFDPEITICSDERASLPISNECRTCCFLPKCTPFYLNGCPGYFDNCREFIKIDINARLRRLAATLD